MTDIAFTSCCILDKVDKVECVEPWGEDSVIIGYSDCKIGFAKVIPIPPPANVTEPFPVQYTGNVEDNMHHPFKNKPIVHMSAIRGPKILVVQAGEGPLTIHEICRGFTLKDTLQKTKGCSCFDVYESPNKQDIFLVAGLKKKIIYYRWSRDRFIEMREVAVADTPRCVSWMGGIVFVGLRREYVLVNMIKGTVEPLCNTGRTLVPNTVRVGDDIMIVRDNTALFFKQDGSPAKEKHKTWSESPMGLAVVGPFVIGVLPKITIEIRLIDPETKEFIQPLHIPGAKYIASQELPDGRGTVCYVATTRGIHRLSMKPLPDIINRLTLEKEFEVALSLCDSLPYDGETVEEYRKSVNLHWAYNKFGKMNFDAALATFAELETDPLVVLSLYPSLLPPAEEERVVKENPERQSLGSDLQAVVSGDYQGSAHQALEHYLLQIRPKYLKPEFIDASIASARTEYVTDYNECKSPATLLDTSLLKVALSVGDRETIENIVSRPNCCHVKEASSMLSHEGQESLQVKLFCQKELHEEALKVLMQMSVSGNHPSMRDELIAYMCHLGDTHRDLVFSSIRQIIRSLPSQSIVLRVFTQNEHVGTPSELNRKEVLSFLDETLPECSIPYLNFLIQEQHETDEFFHNELVQRYLTRIINIYTKNGGYPTSKPYPRPGEEPGELGELRRAFASFLASSRYYTPETFLTGAKFPSVALFDEKALVFSRSGQHNQALAIYALILDDYTAAEDYCNAHYKPDDDISTGSIDDRLVRDDGEFSRDVYYELIHVYLDPGFFKTKSTMITDTKPRVEQALEILSRHYSRINISKAFNLLPADTGLHVLMPFFQRVLSESAKSRREKQIEHALLRSESLRVMDMYMQATAPGLYISEQTLCDICNRPLRTSAFVRYPEDGRLVHLMCYQKNDPKARAQQEAEAKAREEEERRLGRAEDQLKQSNYASTDELKLELPPPVWKNESGSDDAAVGSNPFGESVGIAMSPEPYAHERETTDVASNPFADDGVVQFDEQNTGNVDGPSNPFVL